jgi:hypothetical protein
MMKKLVILFSVLTTSILSADAETGYLAIQVVDLNDSPVAGIRIMIEGNGGSAVSGSDGKARLRLSAGTAEGMSVTLSIASSANKSAYAMLQPYDHRTLVPPLQKRQTTLSRLSSSRRAIQPQQQTISL